MFTIRINFEQSVKEPVVLQNIRPGQTILEIFLKNNIALPHDCGGVCSCSTCHIYLETGNHHLEEMTVREKHFIKRAARPSPTSRLACQCLLVDEAGEIGIVVDDH